ncbi:MAG: tRNA pseudouridine(54/55) synthase Pus10 [Candidatus Diapherotrites archaeon]|nr:tRNA pseudouridine(54/55) synthase Pus10 [Candidatus Diapherotrites archaeon]
MIYFRFFGETPAEQAKNLAKNFLEKLKDFEFVYFGLGFSGKDKQTAKKEFLSLIVSEFEKAGKNFSNQEHEVFLLCDLDRKKVEVEVKPVFIFGHYNKYSREIAQTIHYCIECKGRKCSACNFTGKQVQESVQEIIGKKALEAFSARKHFFHGAGREDVDVLMLGKGRPFVLELAQPKKRKISLKEFEENVNKEKRVRFHSLAFCGPEKVAQVKTTEHDKAYEAVVECEKEADKEKIGALAGQRLGIEQFTPTRVEKRRAKATRKKWAEITRVKALERKKFSLQLKTQAGLYIKEFVSGDSGRTKPSLSSLLGQPCRCVQLDVLEIIEK